MIQSRILSAICLSFFVAGATPMLQEEMFEASAQDTAALEAELRTAIKQDPLLKYIADHFPAESNQMIREVIANPADAREIGFTFTSNLRKSNANAIFGAKMGSLRDRIQKEAALVTAIKEKSGNRACANYLLNGPPGLSAQEQAQHQKQLSMIAKSLFEIIVEGRGKPPARMQATEEDFGRLIAAWKSQGATNTTINALSLDGSADSELSCNAFIGFYETLLTINEAYADRIITEVVYVLASS